MKFITETVLKQASSVIIIYIHIWKMFVCGIIVLISCMPVLFTALSVVTWYRTV